MDIIVGTAGHIDHGKTALVKALTGVDADRLPEEKKRGITIDLGFAELDLGEVRIGFVDVPGHEKFVKNMLAGASGIDLVALVVAADEGVMPQTREHFEICRLLETKCGLIILTKTDLVDQEVLELAKLDVAELVEDSFLADAPVVAVSSITGEGIDDLKNTISSLAQKIPVRKNEIISRLPIDRIFSVKGFGAVVTGTLATGMIETGSEMELLPAKKKVRVRGIQTHGKSVENAFAGQRTAVNLGGIDKDEIERGMLLAQPDVFRPTQIFDAEVEVLSDARQALRTRQRVRVHLGTVEALARIEVLNNENEIKQGEKDYIQIRLEAPLVTIPNERFILRQYSPQITIAGGKVINAISDKHKRRDLDGTRKLLEGLKQADNDKTKLTKIFLETAGDKGFSFQELQARTGFRGETLKESLNANIERNAIINAEDFFVARTPFDNLKLKVLSEIEEHHKLKPLSPGIMRETLREKTSARVSVEVFKTVLNFLQDEKKIVVEKDIVKASSHNQELSADEKLVSDNLMKQYKNAGLQVPKIQDVLQASVAGTSFSDEKARNIFQMLLNSGEIVKISEDFYFENSVIEDLVERVRSFAENESEDRLIGVPKFKEIAGTSRKYAIPILEYFDAEKITRRAGDKRLIL